MMRVALVGVVVIVGKGRAVCVISLRFRDPLFIALVSRLAAHAEIIAGCWLVGGFSMFCSPISQPQIRVIISHTFCPLPCPFRDLKPIAFLQALFFSFGWGRESCPNNNLRHGSNQNNEKIHSRSRDVAEPGRGGR